MNTACGAWLDSPELIMKHLSVLPCFFISLAWAPIHQSEVSNHQEGKNPKCHMLTVGEQLFAYVCRSPGSRAWLSGTCLPLWVILGPPMVILGSHGLTNRCS